MIRHIKKFLIISTLSLLINGCGIATVGKTASKLGDVVGYGAAGNVGVRAFQQNAPLIIILIILCIVVFFIAKHHTSKQTRKNKNSVSSTTKKEKQPKEKLSWDEKSRVENKSQQQQKVGEKIGYWLAKNTANFRDPKTLKNQTPNEKKKQDNKNEIKKNEPKKILTWDEPIKPEPKKEEPVKEIKSSEITITSQEEEAIYSQVAKELKENRNEGVWLKAFTENDGDETKTKIAYTKKRVNLLIEELQKLDTK